MSKPRAGAEERRTVRADVEVRADDDGRVFAEGYAAKFNRYSQNLGGFVEQVAPGAFTRSINSGAEVYALVNHDASKVLGRRGNGTLELSEDEEGLRYRVELNVAKTSVADFVEDLRRRDVHKSSFGFRTLEDEWGETDDGFLLRTLKSVSLIDVSPVTFPAYLDTEVDVSRAMRSLAAHTGIELDELDRFDWDQGVANLGDLLDTFRADPDDRDLGRTPRLDLARRRLDHLQRIGATPSR